ncbi:hypothetical protein KAFR_0G03110 [Kazachstania africana CBS 2517]|uniref:HTH La-type RNA-binding domain-containing protein n=1 Tax=Kazachstania africana (strain ATCC 22294 / BCRC 22015 / CBS 2517 / CECT 1963 / NBRC 1671 / NRRL Y-8276) TaxID=1071382 RepID=H2AY93_KAZAF|nr:hypothetical protein KAFR_0G03110 [Kazachstania africana CBS 2517]CCF59343.1 hypothetical protein KAFR_0G03110 [Kazachstania africana CBS 2517]
MSSSRRNSFQNIEFTPETRRECLKQVEFYFSEFNLPYDKFLRSIVNKNNGWVPISTIVTFNRMKKYRPVETVVEVLKESKILMVSEDGENVKRREALVIDKDLQNLKKIIVMGFPTDKENMQEILEKWFDDVSSGSITQVRLRRERGKKFNGDVIIDFKSVEDCNAFYDKYPEADPLTFEEKKLSLVKKKDFELQKQATKAKNFSGSGQRSRSFSGHRKNMPKLTQESNDEKKDDNEDESAVI